MKLPQGWEIVSLEKVAKIQTGLAKGKKDQKNVVSLPYLRVANVQDGYLDLSEIKEIEVDSSQVNRYLLQNEDILLTEGGDFDKLGRGGIWHCQVNPCLHQNHVFAVRVNKENLIPYFFAQQVSSFYGKAYFLSCAKQTTNLASINSTQLKEFPVLLPPLLEQCKIVEVLGVWDESIDLLERLIGRVRSRKQGLMKQLLTGKKRFKEFEGSEYSIVKLSEVAKIRRGASPRPIQDPKWFAEKGRGWVRIRDVTASNTYLMETTQYLSNLAVEKSVKVDPGDLIMSICATIGVPRIVGIPACIHDGFVVFRELEKYIDKFFLYHYINLISAKISDSGQPGTQKNINTTIVGNIEVPKFSIPEQEKIAAVLSAADEDYQH